jgi:hypothetical protein
VELTVKTLASFARRSPLALGIGTVAWERIDEHLY